jgi:DNA polymerase (family X)
MQTNQQPTKRWSNEEIAGTFETIADLLEAQAANPYRVRAYRQAAGTLRSLPEPAATILERKGVEGLRELPTIGESLSRSIGQLVGSGTIALLERLQGETNPTRVLATVPGIGPVLAKRIYEALGIETLAELEAAAYDGRLDTVPGFGRKRIRAVRETLAGRLRHRQRPAVRPRRPANQPPVSELLEVDQEYRQGAKSKKLPRIAPRRYNPTREAWLPVLHTVRGDAHYTALFSNTARAHELDATHDWVVIYRDDQNGDGQWTVVTARFGPLQGKRVVRGREEETAAYYQQAESAAIPA